MKQDYSKKRVVVVGAGLSGQALVRFLLERGASVVLSDQRSLEQLDGLPSLAGLPVQFDLGGHDLDLFAQADLVAVSPGVPLTIAPLQHAASCQVPICGEVELAARELEMPILAVTGTNGKSTTTSLLGGMLQACEEQPFVGGNLGTPLVNACSDAYRSVVVELSSFQLETIAEFRPHIALLLNLSADHLDRYPDLNSYYQAKARVFQNMSASDYAVLNADDAAVCQLAQDIRATKVWFSAAGQAVAGMQRHGSLLVWNWRGERREFSLGEIQLTGEHNVENVMAALSAALLHGCDADKSWQAICSFRGLEHRMELVRTLDGVRWVNDSKGTNVGSVVKSLAGLPTGSTLIAGGKDKGGEYAPLLPLLREKVAHLLLIGQAAAKMGEQLAGSCQIHQAGDMANAVALARQLTPPGAVVLLSPACSSYDQFRSYEERGRIFAQLVAALPESTEEGAC